MMSQLEEFGEEVEDRAEDIADDIEDLASDIDDTLWDVTRDTRNDWLEDFVEESVNEVGSVVKDFWVNGVEASSPWDNYEIEDIAVTPISLMSKGMVVESTGSSAMQIVGYTAIGLTAGLVGLFAVGAAMKACNKKERV